MAKETAPGDGEWQKLEQVGPYTIWRMSTALGLIYNATRDGNPPKTDAGYFDPQTLKKLKGLS